MNLALSFSSLLRSRFPFAGVHFLRARRAQSRLRNDLLRSGERVLLFGLRILNEIRRQTAAHGAGRHRSCQPCRRATPLEAAPRESLRFLHRFRSLGSRRRRVADAG